MKYIVYKRFKGKAICGRVNLPSLTECHMTDGVICCGGRPLCVATSENAHNYFMRNDDGMGMIRGNLIYLIKGHLSRHKDRWERVWADEKCHKYRRKEHADYWLWNHDFYNAAISELKYIYDMVKTDR